MGLGIRIIVIVIISGMCALILRGRFLGLLGGGYRCFIVLVVNASIIVVALFYATAVRAHV